jgi:hypothetical protein
MKRWHFAVQGGQLFKKFYHKKTRHALPQRLPDRQRLAPTFRWDSERPVVAAKVISKLCLEG